MYRSKSFFRNMNIRKYIFNLHFFFASRCIPHIGIQSYIKHPVPIKLPFSTFRQILLLRGGTCGLALPRYQRGNESIKYCYPLIGNQTHNCRVSSHTLEPSCRNELYYKLLKIHACA